MYCSRKSGKLFENIYKRALRVAYSDFESSFENILSQKNDVMIHQKNLQLLAIEIYKTVKNLNPVFMKTYFS